MTTFGEELIDEALGSSSKRWALLLVAAGIGAATALWLRSRSSHGRPQEATQPPELTSGEDESAPALSATAATKLTSAWTRVSRPPAVLERLPRPRAFRTRESADPAG